jgi:dihydroorotate dehydrogenase/Pyruvate/2-oxoacid:ferredoxin oxidoreductase delta subunit
MADTQTTLCGVTLKNPYIVSSGPLTYGAAGIRRCFAAGAAAAVTKTIRAEAAVNPTPHIGEIGKGGMLNTEKWSDLSAEQWVRVEFPALGGASGVVIASMGHTVADIEQIGEMVVGAPNIQMIELVSYVAGDMAPMVRLVKSMTDLPVLAKMSPNWPDVLDVATACADAGVDGITAADSLGPTLAIDIETARPIVEGVGGHAWMSGSFIKPVIARIVADVCSRFPDLPVVATGGVTTAADVVEMSMLGATCVGVHTAPMLQGLRWFGKTEKALQAWLDWRGYPSLASTRGLALPNLTAGEDTVPLVFEFDVDKCTACNRCVIVCPYAAREMEEKRMSLDVELCRSCGLCVTVCPTGALAAGK